MVYASKANADGPLEAYLLVGDSAVGIARPDDPRVIDYLDKELRQQVPVLKRGGPPELFDTNRGKGAAID